MQGVVKIFLLTILLLFCRVPARADSCSYFANRIYVGIDLLDPLRMGYDTNYYNMLALEGVIKYAADPNFDLITSIGYFNAGKGAGSPGTGTIRSFYITAGGLVKPGYEPDKKFAHLEFGLIYSFAASTHVFFAEIPDFYSNSLKVTETESHNIGALYFESSIVLKPSNRFRLRGYVNAGLIIHHSHSLNGYINYSPGTGIIDERNRCGRVGLSLLVNLFLQGDCNQTAVRYRKEFEYR